MIYSFLTLTLDSTPVLLYYIPMTVERMVFDNNLPIYLQIADYIKFLIYRGELAAGARVPSVREMAKFLGANPNTVQKAYTLLLKEGFLNTKRGIGYFVTSDEGFLQKKKREDLLNFVKEVRDKLEKLGFTVEEFKKELQNE